MGSSPTDVKTKIYVRLLNEGRDVSRPVLALEIGHGVYEILPIADYEPSDEEWEFPPGAHVKLQKREADNGEYFIAIAP